MIHKTYRKVSLIVSWSIKNLPNGTSLRKVHWTYFFRHHGVDMVGARRSKKANSLNIVKAYF